MYKILLKHALVITLFAVHSFSAPLLEDIKGLDLTNEGYEDLNPLHGYVWNQGILENHGEMLDKDNTLRKLIELLFHRTGTFDPSTQPDTNSVVPYLTPETIGNILGALKNKEISLQDLSKRIEGKKYKNARTQINNLQKYLNDLRGDSRAYKVMLALLWYKARTKEDFKHYYRAVRSQNGNAAKDTPADWSAQKFTLADATSTTAPDFNTNYDAYLYRVAKYDADVPPLEHQGYSSVPESFADCGETSLKNLVKLAIDRDGTYDVRVLNNLGAKPEVVDFFKAFPDRLQQTTQKARNAWAQITINLADVTYGLKTPGKQYEICPHRNAADNMLAVLHALFAEFKGVTKWDGVFEKITAARTKVGLGSFTIEKTNLSSGYGTITFAIDKLGRFDWHFETEHFYIDPLPGKDLGGYPLNGIKDIAVFYRLDQLPKANTQWHLYAQLRQNEVIESALKQLKQDHQLTTAIKVALLNRLSTADARHRIFPQVITSEQDSRALIENKAFRPGAAYLSGLINTQQFNSAKVLVNHPFFLKDVKTYFIGHTDEVTSAVFSADGKRVLTASSDKTARIWDAETGQEIKKIEGHTGGVESAVFSVDGKRVLTSSRDETARIWDAETGQEIKKIEGHCSFVRSAVFSSDGKRVLTTVNRDEIARIWDAETGQEITRLSGHTDEVMSAVFSADGTKVLTASMDKTARIWDAETGQEITKLEGNSHMSSAVFSVDSTKALTSSWDKTAQIWDAKTGQEIKKIEGHTGALFSADGTKVLATGNNSEIVRILDAETGQEIKKLSRHTRRVISAVFSADNTKVLTASSDKTAQIWNTEVSE